MRQIEVFSAGNSLLTSWPSLLVGCGKYCSRKFCILYIKESRRFPSFPGLAPEARDAKLGVLESSRGWEFSRFCKARGLAFSRIPEVQAWRGTLRTPFLRFFQRCVVIFLANHQNLVVSHDDRIITRSQITQVAALPVIQRRCTLLVLLTRAGEHGNAR